MIVSLWRIRAFRLGGSDVSSLNQGMGGAPEMPLQPPGKAGIDQMPPGGQIPVFGCGLIDTLGDHYSRAIVHFIFLRMWIGLPP